MLYSVIICIAYIIGIIWGLYLDLYLGIVLLFVFISFAILFNKKIFLKRMLLIGILFFLIGILNTNYRINKSETKYVSRQFLWKRKSDKINR